VLYAVRQTAMYVCVCSVRTTSASRNAKTTVWTVVLTCRPRPSRARVGGGGGADLACCDREDNRRAVEEFADRWRSRGFHDTFQCFYDTNDPSRVIAEKMYTIADVVHSMTWPSLVVVICGLVFLRLQTLSSYWSAGQLVSRLRHHVTD